MRLNCIGCNGCEGCEGCESYDCLPAGEAGYGCLTAGEAGCDCYGSISAVKNKPFLQQGFNLFFFFLSDPKLR